jgi:thiol-disulfide isomerase/thioredoxin
MEKRTIDKELILFFFIFIISILILIGILFFFRSESKIENVGPTSINTAAIRVEGTERESLNECLSRFGITEDTIIFIYSEDCPYSRQVMPAVSELKKRYKVYFADVKNATTPELVMSCLYGIASYTSTPEFVCPANGKDLIGAVEQPELEKFFEECVEKWRK